MKKFWRAPVTGGSAAFVNSSVAYSGNAFESLSSQSARTGSGFSLQVRPRLGPGLRAFRCNLPAGIGRYLTQAYGKKSCYMYNHAACNNNNGSEYTVCAHEYELYNLAHLSNLPFLHMRPHTIHIHVQVIQARFYGRCGK
jgi:hypothetical protein